MNANFPDKTASGCVAMARRDAWLRRIIVIFATASFTAFGLAVVTSMQSRTAARNGVVAMNDAGY